MKTMPPRPQTAAMTPDQLRELMRDHGLNNKQLADALGIHRNTVSRWLKGLPDGTPIDAANSALIRATFKPKKK